MGYTHYWTFKKIPRGKTKEIEYKYQQAIKDIRKIAKKYNNQFEKGDDRRLSGYTAHSLVYGGVKINGCGENAHEDFILREHYKQNLDENYSGFCKTSRKSYDLVVVAALAILKYRLGDLVEISSDGDYYELCEGTLFAINILNRKIKCPIIRDHY